MRRKKNEIMDDCQKEIQTNDKIIAKKVNDGSTFVRLPVYSRLFRHIYRIPPQLTICKCKRRGVSVTSNTAVQIGWNK